MKKARVVTKAQYARRVAKKAGLFGISNLLMLVGGLGFLLSLVAALLFLISAGVGPSYEAIPPPQAEVHAFARQCTLCAGACLVGAIGCGGMFVAGARVLRRAANAEPVHLLTRATIAALPADETLLRAGDTPTQAQETLLRAAQGAGEETGEELLRGMSEGSV